MSQFSQSSCRRIGGRLKGFSVFFITHNLGEEALVDFSESDGLYGSKHLAKKWSNSTSVERNDGAETELDRILLFVLLDLIGQAAPEFRSFAVSKTLASYFQDKGHSKTTWT